MDVDSRKQNGAPRNEVVHPKVAMLENDETALERGERALFCCQQRAFLVPDLDHSPSDGWIHSRSEARLMALMRSADEAKWKRLSAKSKSLGRAWVGPTVSLQVIRRIPNDG